MHTAGADHTQSRISVLVRTAVKAQASSKSSSPDRKQSPNSQIIHWVLKFLISQQHLLMTEIKYPTHTQSKFQICKGPKSKDTGKRTTWEHGGWNTDFEEIKWDNLLNKFLLMNSSLLQQPQHLLYMTSLKCALGWFNYIKAWMETNAPIEGRSIRSWWHHRERSRNLRR